MKPRDACAPQKRWAPAPGGDRIEALKGQRSSSARDLAPNPHYRQAVPDTVMAHAFLRALMRWAKRRPNTDAWIAIPTGTVTAGELARVVCALGLVDREGRP